LVPFSWDNIGWMALAHQLPTVLVVCIVCSFGVSMDIMAVQVRHLLIEIHSPAVHVLRCNVGQQTLLVAVQALSSKWCCPLVH
jgi:hypothetical protein